MTEIRFYHMEQSPLDQALPGLAAKAYAAGKRILIKAPDKREVKRLDDLLWSFHPLSFLPHGTDRPDRQPVFLSCDPACDTDNPNGADMVILTHGCTAADPAAYDLCCEMLDGRVEEHVTAARARWRDYKQAGFTLTYWQQDAQGAWARRDA